MMWPLGSSDRGTGACLDNSRCCCCRCMTSPARHTLLSHRHRVLFTSKECLREEHAAIMQHTAHSGAARQLFTRWTHQAGDIAMLCAFHTATAQGECAITDSKSLTRR